MRSVSFKAGWSWHYYARRHFRMTQAVREAKDYSADERRQFKEAFRPQAAAYRRHRRTTLVWFFAAMGCLLLGMFADGILKRDLLPSMTMPFFGCGAIWFVMMLITPKLVCPGCSRDIEVPFGDYCPQCGCEGLEAQRGYKPAHCKMCGKSMNAGRVVRRYIIRNCTHCGLLLDERGL